MATRKNLKRKAAAAFPGEGKDHTKARLGMAFEKRIETTNKLYEHTGKAVIRKVPTPTKNIKGKIVYSDKSTVDFIGTVGGHAIAFEAKETTGNQGKPETNFPLTTHKKEMVSQHQRDFLRMWGLDGGMAFVLISFKNRGECFAVPVLFIEKYYRNMYFQKGRKSIPFDAFREEWRVDVDDYLGLMSN